MDATQAKQIADNLNQDNTQELDEVMQKIANAAYQGLYFIDLDAPLSLKTSTYLYNKGFMVITANNEWRITWEL